MSRSKNVGLPDCVLPAASKVAPLNENVVNGSLNVNTRVPMNVPVINDTTDGSEKVIAVAETGVARATGARAVNAIRRRCFMDDQTVCDLS